MNCIFTAKYLVSGDAPPVEGGALLVREGKIQARGSLPELKRRNPGAEVIDFAEAIMVPLLINAHTHLELTDYPLWREKAGHEQEAESFVDWILQLIKIKSGLDKRDYFSSLENGIQQSLACGTGAVGDILAHHRARTVYQSGALTGRLFLETLGQEPASIQRVKKALDGALRESTSGLMTLGLSPHSPYTIRADYLQKIYSRCRREGIYCTTHLAESAEEVDFIEHGRGALAGKFYPFVGWQNYLPPASSLRPTEYLEQQGGLFPQNLLVHGVQLNEAEIELLGRNGMYLALCPRSNARLRVGKAAAGKLLAAGVRLALGTDSLASCDSLSIWDEMAFAHRWFAGELDAPRLFQLATMGGADALGLGHQLGSLSNGKAAGFQVLVPQTTVAVKDLFDYFVAPGRTQDIVEVYHRGQPQLSRPDHPVKMK